MFGRFFLRKGEQCERSATVQNKSEAATIVQPFVITSAYTRFFQVAA